MRFCMCIDSMSCLLWQFQMLFWHADAAGGPVYSQVVMNLPASAVNFLDAFRDACSDERWCGRLPTINCYTFSKGDEDEAGALVHSASLGQNIWCVGSLVTALTATTATCFPYKR